MTMPATSSARSTTRAIVARARYAGMTIATTGSRAGAGEYEAAARSTITRTRLRASGEVGSTRAQRSIRRAAAELPAARSAADDRGVREGDPVAQVAAGRGCLEAQPH